jgi:hypothetical protein
MACCASIVCYVVMTVRVTGSLEGDPLNGGIAMLTLPATFATMPLVQSTILGRIALSVRDGSP